MNKYRDKSDFEINKAVAVTIGAKPFPPERTEFKQCEIPGFENAIIVKITSVKTGPFDPCNNPADAMPIIMGNRIDIRLMGRSEGKKRYWVEYAATAFDETDDGEIITVFTSPNKNIYRAAMEVFLMMKDMENEKV